MLYRQEKPNMRLLPNKDVMFPRKGEPPACLSGYRRDKVDPYLFHPLAGPCVYRGTEYVKQICGGKDIRYACLLGDEKVTPFQCSRCNRREPPMDDKPVYIVYFTTGTKYQLEADECIKTLKQFGLKFKCYEVPNFGTWQKNTQHKAKVVRYALNDNKENIVYLDADARIRQYPKLFDTLDADMGCHFRRGRELLSGTVFFKNCPACHMVVNDWIEENKQHPDLWDQKTLHAVVLRYQAEGKLKVENTPPAYTQIHDSMAHYGAPVIEHMQASRTLKKALDRGECKL